MVAPLRSDAALSAAAETAPTQRDRRIQVIVQKGRMAWQRMAGYNERARVEAAIARYKQVIGDRLRAHTNEGRRGALLHGGSKS